MTRRTHLKYIISHTHSHTHTHTHTPCPLSTESAHWKRPDLCKALVSSTFSRFTCRSSLVHQCVIPLIVVLPMLRLRWTLLNSPSCLIHILHIVIVYPLVALGVPWNHEQSFFFGGTFFFCSYGKKKEGSRGGGIPETGNRNRNIRKQQLFHNVSETRTRFPMFPKHVPKALKEKPIARTCHPWCGVCVLLCVVDPILGNLTVPGSFLKSGDLGLPDPHPLP